MTTERIVLDALHTRFCRRANGGHYPPRWTLAEHVHRGPSWGERILDAVALDMNGGNFGADAAMANEVHGFEVKVSRSDLAAELRDPIKAGTFCGEDALGSFAGMEGYLSHFNLLAPKHVIDAARDMGVPDEWGLLQWEHGKPLRYRRKPTRLPNQGAFTPRDVAQLTRAVAKTTWRCADLHPEEYR